ncbi:MAG: chromosome partitioning protein ParA [Candidatus Tectimicrobiota bacterium]|nr:MAG: chromosome partitioning protein ParA [Candidatus Tectomicrobia bacterium]
MGRILAIANQKGGVGKTTTAINLAACLGAAEQRTLLVDFDPQSNTTSGMGVAVARGAPSVYEVLLGAAAARTAIVPKVVDGVDVLPATRDLVGAELELVPLPAREQRLRQALAPVVADYDFVLIDCPPSLGLLTLNALTAAHGVLVPLQCEYYALEGLGQLLRVVRLVQQRFNPGLAVAGILLTMYDGRTLLARRVAEEARRYFGATVFDTVIPRNVKLGEAPSHGKPIIHYDIGSSGAAAYLRLTQELLHHEATGTR